MSGLADQFDLKDPEQAKEYLDTLAIEYRFQCYHEQIPDGCHRLAGFLEAFRNDYEKALVVYRTNCFDNNFSASCFKYGNFKLLGRGCDKDPSESLKAFNLGCELDDSPSCNNAAVIYQQGKGLDSPDYIKAKSYFEKGCTLDDGQCCQKLSTYYITGKKGIEKNFFKAFEYGVKACNLNHIAGCVNVGQMYKNGDGVEKNLEKFEEYKAKALKLHKELMDPDPGVSFGK